MPGVIIGVDLGGTRIRAARLDQQLHVLHRQETLTRASEGLEPTLQRIKALIRSVLPDESATPVMGIGISAPGPLNPETGVIVAPPNLPGWHNVPLGKILHDEFNVPVYVGNDANVAALAEATRGAARGYRHVIFITVSTGIGSGIIYDGRLLLGRSGLAAEAGHMIMITGDDHVSSLEKEAAGPALARQLRTRIEAGETSIASDMVEGDLNRIDGRIVGEAARNGDALAKQVVTRAGRMVGLGITTLLHLFNPEIVVIGGGVSSVGDLLFDPMRAAVQEHALDSSYWEDLSIVPAALGEDVSIIGAAALVITEGGQADATKVLDALKE